MAGSGVWVGSVHLPNLRSSVHRWPLGASARSDTDVPRRAARVRAEIEEVLADVNDRDAWIFELEARLAAATDKVRQLRGRLGEGA
jgi:hypothetical protein